MMENLKLEIQSLVSKAFVLEALTDKLGCTTRFHDLNGKPLKDFVIAGINCAPVFQELADLYEKDPKTPVFSLNLKALKVSNKHKSSKFINFGLLEIMFPAVAARLRVDDPQKIIEAIISVVKNSTNKDVRHLLATRKLAWSTSSNRHKINFQPEQYENLASVWDFYM